MEKLLKLLMIYIFYFSDITTNADYSAKVIVCRILSQVVSAPSKIKLKTKMGTGWM